MFELTNEQRRCFALPVVLDHWQKIEIAPGTYIYLDGHRIAKIVQVCEDPQNQQYSEYAVDRMLSEDHTMLLPKTTKGSPQKITWANLKNCTPVGMSLNYGGQYLSIVNHNSEQAFYCSAYDDVDIGTFDKFKAWVDIWCKETDQKALREIRAFAARKRTHHAYKEGDFFRYRINRFLYGYGRILINFDKKRKDGTAFWDVFMGKPLCVAVYHIATENAEIKPEELVGKKMMPAHMIMDNVFYYGECEIIGNIPLSDEQVDYPIQYGWGCTMEHPNRVCYQRGNLFVTRDDSVALFRDFKGGIGWNLKVTLPILRECICADSNEPYWRSGQWGKDLRNPKYADELRQIKEQMGIE